MAQGRGTFGSADIAAGLTELSALLLSVEEIEEALDHLARMAVQIIPDGPSCGITVIQDGRPTTIVYTGTVPSSVHEDQFALGEGPCPEALRMQSPVVVQDLATEERWGEYPRAALAAGAHGVYAHPLDVDDRTVGTLSIYAHEPNLFPRSVQHVAAQVAAHAEVLLSAVVRHASQAELTRQLQIALSSRAVIDQALGIIMAQRLCSPDEAFAHLRTTSNNRNIKLRELAERKAPAQARPVRVADRPWSARSAT